MQLILETENTNISISEKMSSLEQETGDIPVSNGEVKGILEEVNRKSEESINDNKIENKENVTANAENPKEAGDSTTPQASNGDSAKLAKTEELSSPQCENNLIKEITKNEEKPENGPSETKSMKNGENPNEEQKVEDIALNTTNGLPSATENGQSKSDVDVPPKKDIVQEKSESLEESGVEKHDETSGLNVTESIKESQMDIDQDEEIIKEKNINQNKNDVPINTQNDKVEPMEVDFHIARNLEKEVTESISAMVSEIVQHLNEDDTDNTLDSAVTIDKILETGITFDDKNVENSKKDTTKINEADATTKKSDKQITESDDTLENIPTQSEISDSDSVDAKLKLSVSSSINENDDKTFQGSEKHTVGVDAPLDKNDDEENKLKVTDNSEHGNNAAEITGQEKVHETLIEKTTEHPENDIIATSVKPAIPEQKSLSVDNEAIVEKEESAKEDMKKGCALSSESACLDEEKTQNNVTKEDTKTITSSESEPIAEKAVEPLPNNQDKNQKVVPDNILSEKQDITDDVEEVKIVEDVFEPHPKNKYERIPNLKTDTKEPQPIIKLSNTMDILSDDDEDEGLKGTPSLDKEVRKNEMESADKQCINLDDDDDVMLIDEDTSKDDKKDTPNVDAKSQVEQVAETNNEVKVVELDTSKEEEFKGFDEKEIRTDLPKPSCESKDEPKLETVRDSSVAPEKTGQLVPNDFFKTYRKNLADMTRDDLEEFCILKIVESIIDRSNLNEIRSKLKTMSQTIEEYKKKAIMLTKQNRDLQVVLKSVQEEQKKSSNQSITPLKIMRSVGMQVLMTDKNRRRPPGSSGVNSPIPSNMNPISNNANNTNITNNRQPRNLNPSPRGTPQKQAPPIPVPRLVPAAQNMANRNLAGPAPQSIAKPMAVQNGMKLTSPNQKPPEKRPHARVQSVTVDLTDDEPPVKVPAKNSPAPPVRLVNAQNLLAQRPQIPQAVNSPRKVFIPINLTGPSPQNVRPGQTVMLKTPSPQGPRPRGQMGLPSIRPKPSNVPLKKLHGARHPAPLPDAMKQYQPPNWKALPPAPDLKLSKVENGIVISWKIEGYQEDSYEDIASYQLYAYQETSAPPSTSLWKKIGDVKALPLPMACTLTQFMAGYKYYFAVRAVDIRSRLGPFSLPGSILLLNKV